MCQERIEEGSFDFYYELHKEKDLQTLQKILLEKRSILRASSDLGACGCYEVLRKVSTDDPLINEKKALEQLISEKEAKK